MYQKEMNVHDLRQMVYYLYLLGFSFKCALLVLLFYSYINHWKFLKICSTLTLSHIKK